VRELEGQNATLRMLNPPLHGLFCAQINLKHVFFGRACGIIPATLRNTPIFLRLVSTVLDKSSLGPGDGGAASFQDVMRVFIALIGSPEGNTMTSSPGGFVLPRLRCTPARTHTQSHLRCTPARTHTQSHLRMDVWVRRWWLPPMLCGS
jgi:hypothetical protein